MGRWMGFGSEWVYGKNMQKQSFKGEGSAMRLGLHEGFVFDTGLPLESPMPTDFQIGIVVSQMSPQLPTACMAVP